MVNDPQKPAAILSLLLHDVTDDPGTSGFMQPTAFRYKHSVSQFLDYLDVVESTGLPITTVVEPLQAGTSVSFTFDDGGAAAPIAADLLEDRGWRGLFFITTDLIGQRGFMNAAQICDLHRRGHVIGSHSCSHPDIFRSLTRAQMQREWSQSRDELQQLLGADVTAGSVPGGDCCRSAVEEAAAAGLLHLFTSEQLTRPWIQAGTTCYGRLMMVDTTAPETLSRWLRYPTVGILPERIVRFTKTSVKQLMGPMYRRLVQRRRAQHEHA